VFESICDHVLAFKRFLAIFTDFYRIMLGTFGAIV
jgi:hypothetical protein